MVNLKGAILPKISKVGVGGWSELAPSQVGGRLAPVWATRETENISRDDKQEILLLYFRYAS